MVASFTKADPITSTSFVSYGTHNVSRPPQFSSSPIRASTQPPSWLRKPRLQEVPIKNYVYLMLGASFGSTAKGTGIKALEFALSMCDSVDMYGFTVYSSHKEWTRYFSESLQVHTPLYGELARSEDPLAPCSIINKKVKRNLNAVSKRVTSRGFSK
ncbi:hypothetical protein Fmac_010923 [Flemingia macrophylla]|uniref:Uncharacterized protein n=1 Tax=Flemingia macrophylla TaxID=520843 RepID=A0ABD1MKY2_9FABA